MSKENEKLLSVSEIALKLRRSNYYVYKLAKLGAPIHSGRGYFSEILAWIKETNGRPFKKNSKP